MQYIMLICTKTKSIEKTKKTQIYTYGTRKKKNLLEMKKKSLNEIKA